MPEKPDALLDNFCEDDDYRPDPWSLRISAAAMRRRAALAGLDAEAAADLIAYAADYCNLAAGIDGRRVNCALETTLETTNAPDDQAAAFFLTGGFVGVVESARPPSIGAEVKTFRLAASSSPGVLLASAELVLSASGDWEILHVEVDPGRRREGLASMLYDRIEEFLGAKLRPSGWLSGDAYAFWRRRDAQLVAGYRRIEPFLDLWISPRQLLNLMIIDLAKIEALMQSDEAQAAQRLH